MDIDSLVTFNGLDPTTVSYLTPPIPVEALLGWNPHLERSTFAASAWLCQRYGVVAGSRQGVDRSA